MSLFQNRKFLVLLFANSASDFGDLLRVMALTFWIFTDSGASPWLRALQLMLVFLPSVLLSPLAGTLSDRFDRRILMLVADIIRALVSGALMWAFLLHSIGTALVLIMLGEVLAVFFAPARFSLVPYVVGNSTQLLRANGISDTVLRTLSIIGPGAATLIYFSLGAGWAFSIDALTFLISAAAISTISIAQLRPEDETTPETTPAIKQIWDDMVVGIVYLMRNPVTLFFLITTLGLTITSATNQVSLIFLITKELHQPLSSLAWVFAVSSAAQLVTGVFVTIMSKHFKAGWMLVIAMAVMALTQLGMGLAPNLLILIIWVLIGAFANAPYSIAYDTVLQQSVDEIMMGRVYGVMMAVDSALRLAIFASAALVIQQVGARQSTIGAGFLGLACAVVGITALLPAISHREKVQQQADMVALVENNV